MEVICERCGLWRDPQTVVVVEEFVVKTREELGALASEPSRPEG
jgi:hypothetical protein